jgi:hypothetical protein
MSYMSGGILGVTDMQCFKQEKGKDVKHFLMLTKEKKDEKLKGGGGEKKRKKVVDSGAREVMRRVLRSCFDILLFSILGAKSSSFLIASKSFLVNLFFRTARSV